MFKTITFGLMVLSLGACQHIEDFKQVKEPVKAVVTANTISTDIEYDYKKCVIEKDQKKKLRDFVMAHGIDQNDELNVAYADIDPKLAQKRIRTLAKALKDLGLSARFYPTKTYENAQNLKLSLQRYQVHVPNCPNWSHKQGRDFNNETTPNFGCSTESNLALMIANPKDLLEGPGLSEADGNVLSNAISQYKLPRQTDGSGGEE